MLNFISTVIFTATMEHFAKLYKRFKSKRISGRSLKGVETRDGRGTFSSASTTTTTNLPDFFKCQDFVWVKLDLHKLPQNYLDLTKTGRVFLKL